MKQSGPFSGHYKYTDEQLEQIMARGHHLKHSHAFWFFLVFSFLQLTVIMKSLQRCISSSFPPCMSPEERRYRKSWTVVFVKPLNTNSRHYRLFHAPSGRSFFATKINYYSNSVASFQMMRLTRSGHISENPGPNNSLRCFFQNVRSLKKLPSLTEIHSSTSVPFSVTLLMDTTWMLSA